MPERHQSVPIVPSSDIRRDEEPSDRLSLTINARTKGKRRGFAVMAPERQREIASLGGRTAHERGRAHEFTPDEGRVAGSKGGAVVSLDRQHMATIGRLGSQRRWRTRREHKPEALG